MIVQRQLQPQQHTVPPNQWQDYCDSFSREHKGWLVTVGVIDTQVLDAQPTAADARMNVLAHDLPLQGLTLEDRAESQVIEIVCGDDQRHIAHRIPAPTRLEPDFTPTGAHRGLRIDNDAGQTTLLSFRIAAHPEDLDGIAQSQLPSV